MTLYGAHLSPTLTFYFGDWPTPYVEYHSEHEVRVEPPPASFVGALAPCGGVFGARLAMGREDGVLVLSQVMYAEVAGGDTSREGLVGEGSGSGDIEMAG